MLGVNIAITRHACTPVLAVKFETPRRMHGGLVLGTNHVSGLLEGNASHMEIWDRESLEQMR